MTTSVLGKATSSFVYLFGPHLIHFLVNVVTASKPGEGVARELLVIAVEQQELGRLRAEGKGQELEIEPVFDFNQIGKLN